MMQLQAAVIGHGRQAVLSDLTLSFHPGEFVAIVGANGAGKTTLLRTLAGFLSPLAGEILLDGSPLRDISVRSRARKLAYVEGETPVFGSITVHDLVAQGRLPSRAWWEWSLRADDERVIEAALATCNLQALAGREFALLSSGERQRVLLAAAFAQATPYLLLDEPTSRLDVRYALEVLELLRQTADQGTTVITSMHDLDRAILFADRILVVGEHGLLVDAPPRQALSADVLERAYGVPFAIRYEGDRIWLAPGDTR